VTAAPPEQTLRLRRFRWWDIERVLPLERELFGATAWSAETFWSELAQSRTRWYVVAEAFSDQVSDQLSDQGSDEAADAGAALLGYAGLMITGAEADVQTIAVKPSAQRRGVGSLLLRGLLAEAGRRGATSVLLEVRADNDGAIALYRRHGFERIAVRRGYYQPNNVDAWVMRLRPVRLPE